MPHLSSKKLYRFGIALFAALLLGLFFNNTSAQKEKHAALQAIRDAGGRFGYDYEMDAEGFSTRGDPGSVSSRQ